MLNKLKGTKVVIKPKNHGLTGGQIEGELVDYDEKFIEVKTDKGDTVFCAVSAIYTIAESKKRR